MKEKIEIKSVINAPVEKTWEYYTSPKHITQWNFASDDWACPKSENDLRIGGKFSSRMEEKNSGEGFDFEGTYTNIVKFELIEYIMDDNRKVKVEFIPENNKTIIKVNFEAEDTNPIEMQKNGWQAILNNFKKYVEEN